MADTNISSPLIVNHGLQGVYCMCVCVHVSVTIRLINEYNNLLCNCRWPGFSMNIVKPSHDRLANEVHSKIKNEKFPTSVH